MGGDNSTSINEEGIKLDYSMNDRSKFFADYAESRAAAVVGAAAPYPRRSMKRVRVSPTFRSSVWATI